MQTPGTYISAVGHIGLIGWLILGWGFNAEPLKFETMDVSVISGEEFAAMTAAARTPEPGQAEPEAPVPPVVDPTPPPPPAVQEPPAPAPPPEPVTPPVEEVPPPPPPPAPPVAEVVDVAPVEPAPPAAPPPAPDMPVSPRPTPRQAPVVASTISEPPPPDAQVDDIVRQEASPDQSPEAEVVQEEQEPTAPEETTTEIVIEDEKPSGAVETSIRPSARPSRPTPPAPESVETPAPQVAETAPEPVVPQDDINNLLADLGAETPTETPASSEAPAVPLGQRLSGTEVGNVQSAIARQWQVDPGSQSAQIVVTVAFSLGRDGRIEGDVTLVSPREGSSGAVDAAFQRARRALWAVSRSGGFPFPAEKYDQWKEIEAQFDPSGVRLR